MKWKWPEAAQRWKGALRRYQYVLLVIAVGAVLLLLPTGGRDSPQPEEPTREEGASFDRIVCCGGDGTLNETVSGLMRLSDPPPLGYIPSGSTNDFAASLELSPDALQTAKRITASQGRALDAQP